MLRRSQLLTILYILSGSAIFAQNNVFFRIGGTGGEPLVGVTIVVENGSHGTITNREGKADLRDLPNGKVKVMISHIGFEDQQILLSFPEDNARTCEIEMDEAEESLEEVVIQTTRASRNIADIPTRIEVITSEELGEKAAMNSSNIGMLLSETTGVLMQQTSLSSGNLSIRIQGLDGRYTQILRDGFPLYGGFAGGLSIMQIPPLDLKQVELIKGSNSTLYGGGAIAGLVNLVSITPEEDPELSIMLNQTSARGTTGNIFYAQKYGKTGFTFYGSGSNQIAYDPDQDGFSNMPDARTINLNPRLFFYFNPVSELSVGVSTSLDRRTGGNMQALKSGKSGPDIFTEKNYSRRIATQFQYLYNFNAGTLTVKNSVNHFNRELTVPDFLFKGKQLSSFTEILYNRETSLHTNWQFGANYYLENFTEEQNDPGPDRSYSHKTIGGFIQNTTDLGPQFTIEGGLRTDYTIEYGAHYLPRIAFLYKVNRKLTTRLGGALGYKLPSIFSEDAERLYFRGILPISPSSIRPETSAGGNLDFNFRTTLFDQLSFSLNHMFFLTQLNHSLVLRQDDNLEAFYFENADGIILSSGFETNMKVAYGDFKFFLNYAFVNVDLRYDNINNQKPLTARHNAGFVFIYEVEEKWSAGYELYYTGSQFDMTYNAKPDFWIMGVMLMRMFERFTLFINFENFTDVIQTDFEPVVLPPYNNPTFADLWAPTDGFVFNGGVKINIIK